MRQLTHLMAFDQLLFLRKIVFVHKPYPEMRSVVYVKRFQHAGQLGELKHNDNYK